LLGATADSLETAVQRRMEEIKALQDEIKTLRARAAATRASELAEEADNGAVVARVDGLAPGDLRDLAVAVRAVPSVRLVVLAGVTDTGGVSLVAAVGSDVNVTASTLISAAAKAVGGGGGGKGDIATAGGKNPAGLDDAMTLAREAVEAALAHSVA
jgi:alanyl-tRNA synthetase